MFTNTKIQISGSKIEVLVYSVPVEYGFEQKKDPNQVPKEADQENQRLNQVFAAIRAKQTIRNLIYANGWQWQNPKTGKPFRPIFITLTFAENVKDLKVAHKEFMNFTKRLNYDLFKGSKYKLHYIAVPEFQKRGAVHYHVVYFNLPFIKNIYDRISKIWGNGFTLIESVKNISHLSNYVVKYISKEFELDRIKGAKRYLVSKGIKRPLVIRNDILATRMIHTIPKEKMVYENQKMFDKKVSYYYRVYEYEQGITFNLDSILQQIK
jgi:hypothetical protein